MNIIRNRGGFIEFTPEFSVDANLDNSIKNYFALQALFAEAKSEK